MKNERLLNRAFKLRFGLKICLFTLLGGGGVLLLLAASLSRGVGSSYAEAIYTIYDLRIRILPLVFASSYSLVLLALLTVAIAVISALFSHKIAGPIYRIKKNLDVIGKGDLTVFTRFRGNDQLSVLAEELNGMVRSLNHTARRVIDGLGRLSISEDRLREALEADAPEEEIRALIEGIRAGTEEITRAVSALKADE